jgi:predicted phosphodiesterase
VRPLGGHASGPRLVIVHGTPTLNTVYWTEDRSDDFCRKMAAMVALKSGDAIAFGHTHIPWHRTVDGVHFVNTGSVGRPKDGDWRACYVRLELGRGAVGVELVRVGYDIDATVAGVRAAGLPEDFVEFLRTGGKPLADAAV